MVITGPPRIHPPNGVFTLFDAGARVDDEPALGSAR
jgi:hypothetical protein